MDIDFSACTYTQYINNNLPHLKLRKVSKNRLVMTVWWLCHDVIQRDYGD